MKAMWDCKFEDMIFPQIVRADTFLEAVEEARKISEKIISIVYLAY
jgi:hypothetical protein